jgi:hypothetical protein
MALGKLLVSDWPFLGVLWLVCGCFLVAVGGVRVGTIIRLGLWLVVGFLVVGAFMGIKLLGLG